MRVPAGFDLPLLASKSTPVIPLVSREGIGGSAGGRWWLGFAAQRRLQAGLRGFIPRAPMQAHPHPALSPPEGVRAPAFLSSFGSLAHQANTQGAVPPAPLRSPRAGVRGKRPPHPPPQSVGPSAHSTGRQGVGARNPHPFGAQGFALPLRCGFRVAPLPRCARP